MAFSIFRYAAGVSGDGDNKNDYSRHVVLAVFLPRRTCSEIGPRCVSHGGRFLINKFVGRMSSMEGVLD